MDSFLKEDESCYLKYIQILETNVAILKVESGHSKRITTEFENKLEWFNNVSNALSDKLQCLMNIGENHSYIKNDVKVFADQLTALRTHTTKQICEQYSKIRVASCTLPGEPLTTVLNTIRKEVLMVKLSLKMDKMIDCNDYKSKYYTLFNKIAELLYNLEKCDTKVQQYLAITKLVPYLKQLESALHNFVLQSDMLTTRTSFLDFTVFTAVSKLLTGQLFDHEYINPHQVLMENAPKKPVFIVKNNKRRVGVPILPIAKRSKT